MKSRKTDISLIDAKYLGIVLREYLSDHLQSAFAERPKFSFPCPFCSEFRKKESKKKSRVASLYWVDSRGCYRFGCFNHGDPRCIDKHEFPQFLELLNKDLFRRYQLERFHEGTTGGRWNCPHPPGVGVLRNSKSVTNGRDKDSPETDISDSHCQKHSVHNPFI